MAILKAIPNLDDLWRDAARVSDVPLEAIPALRGRLKELDVRLEMRQQAVGNHAAERSGEDRTMDAKETARRMGVSLDYVFKHAAEFPFAWKQSRRWVFSAQGLAQYQEEQRRKKAKERT